MTYLGESGAFLTRCYGNNACSALQNLLDVFITKLITSVLIVHQSTISSLPQQILYLTLAQLRSLQTVNNTPIDTTSITYTLGISLYRLGSLAFMTYSTEPLAMHTDTH